eukprot:6953571-Prymnesium_polylepis.1
MSTHDPEQPPRDRDGGLRETVELITAALRPTLNPGRVKYLGSPVSGSASTTHVARGSFAGTWRYAFARSSVPRAATWARPASAP